ncbi:MAG: hypothetical protein OIN86_05570 [Candidatus Methanoperedens sp.]|nr:hypothetical protein [Candidatus Methanoperedens sp.]CAG1001590.1 hypothetical protein METP1_02934 [Methanosarcinales archaeon]
MNAMSNDNAEDKYIPGVCNIGKSEIKRRKQAGWSGLIITVILLGLLVYFDVPRPWRLVIFIPAMMTAIGFLQAHMHFCAYFGMQGVFNFSPEIGKTDTVEQAEFRAMDRRKAWQIITYSAIIGAVIAIISYYLPL